MSLLTSAATKGFLGALAVLCGVFQVAAQENEPVSAHPKFLGAQSCSSSSCHGGAGDNRHQFTVWSKLDFHTRSYATLTTARSERIAEVLKIGDPTQSARCTACHAPFHSVPAAQLDKSVVITEGVSCGSCHGPAENWLRSHTRTDFSHADRMHAGMRDLKNLYVRANACVACHQNVDADLLQAGHPELIFELDGQAVSQPKHWREKGDWSGPQTWLVGQAVALREMSWQLEREKEPVKNLINCWNGLLWLLEKASAVDKSLPAAPANLSLSTSENPVPAPDPIARARDWSDQLAREAATVEWSSALTRNFLNALSGTADAFDGKTSSRQIQARRAERLVLGLDRLVMGLKSPDKPLDSALEQLFKDVQSLPDFDPAQFADHLREFQKAVTAAK